MKPDISPKSHKSITIYQVTPEELRLIWSVNKAPYGVSYDYWIEGRGSDMDHDLWDILYYDELMNNNNDPFDSDSMEDFILQQQRFVIG